MGSLLAENNRRYDRHQTLGMVSNLTDGKATVIGVVEDVSPTGLRISQVPASFNDNAPKCFTVVNGPVADFAISLQPKWMKVTNKGMYKMIGFEIKNPPENWKDFIKEAHNKNDFFGFFASEETAAV